MDVLTYLKNHISTLDFSEEDTIRLAYFKDVSSHNVYRLHYYRKDLVDTIYQKEVVEMIEGRTLSGDTEIVDYFRWIADRFELASTMTPEELRRGIAESYLKLGVTSIVFEDLESKGFQSLASLQREVMDEGFLKRISFYDDVKNLDLQDFMTVFPMEVTEYEKNEFSDYGDDEVEYTEDELEEIISQLKLNLSEIPSDIDHESDLKDFEDEPRTQDQRVADHLQDMVRHIENTKVRHTSHGRFPFDFTIHRIRWFIDEESLGLDPEHLSLFLEQVERTTVPGFTFTVETKVVDGNFDADIKILTYIDSAKN
ncbi:MAG TPA: hypothetical protein DCQ90_09020 [Erysipelotrichaceae bacterium]|nr:hypothetical protein [Erysipelotrichaceae bacterium]